MERWAFETEVIRKAVDEFKTSPNVERGRRVERAFADFNKQLGELETQAKAQTGDERAATEERIADLKHRRDIHWARCQAPPMDAVPIRVAERVPPRAQPVKRLRNAIPLN